MREIAPAALRYQLLQAGPGRTPWVAGGVSGVIGMGATIIVAASAGVPELGLLSPFIGAIAGALTAYAKGPIESLKNLHAVPVSLVPWGLVLEPDKAPAPLPWKEVQSIKYALVSRDRREDSDATKMAIVVFELRDGRRVQASAEEGEWLVSVSELHGKLAAAAKAPPAADLQGAARLETGGLPATLALLRRADAILDSAEGRASLGLEMGGYRTTLVRAAGEETRRVLHAAMWNGEAKIDPGPLALILAAKLHATVLLPHVLELILSPSPLLAAIARAAAVRLGATLMSAGSLDETRLFTSAVDRAELEMWMTR